MADWTLLNLKDDVEDSAASFGLSPDLEARFARKPLEVEGGGFSYQRLAPGYVLQFGHRHRTHEETRCASQRRSRAASPRDRTGWSSWRSASAKPATPRCSTPSLGLVAEAEVQ